MYNYTPDKIIASLAENNYFANRRIAYAILNVLRDDASPLLIEGERRALPKRWLLCCRFL